MVQEIVIDYYADLTPREREVLILIAEGRSNKQIGEHLRISKRTAEIHRANIMKKLKIFPMGKQLRQFVQAHGLPAIIAR